MPTTPNKTTSQGISIRPKRTAARSPARLERAPLSAVDALAIARERFPNLGASGILPKRGVGMAVDLHDIDIALSFLRQCRMATAPAVHSADLCRLIGVQPGALIAAAVALGFPTQSWLGVSCYAPGAMIAVNANDVRRVAASRRT